MSIPIPYTELPRWVPGDLLLNSDDQGWKDVAVRGFRYREQDVQVPGMAEFMIVSYRQGDTTMRRRFDGKWTRTQCHPGQVSLLTRCQTSHWDWTQPIDVTHAYLASPLLARVAEDVLDRPVSEIRLHDVLSIDDPVVTGIVDALAGEAQGNGIGGRLFADTLGTQLALHMLRRYAHVEFRDRSETGRLPPAACRRIAEYIEDRLDQPLPLDELAAVAGMGVWSFGKRFRESFGLTPHAFVLDRRVERAKRLLTGSVLPLKAIAAMTGFSDQAHFSRVMKARTGQPPGALRQGRRASSPHGSRADSRACTDFCKT